MRVAALAVLATMTCAAHAQTANPAISTPARPAPPSFSGIPDYGGVRTEVAGIWLPPVANAPFTATVDILTHEKLPNGTERIRTTTNHIARSSNGRIYNERRLLVPATFKGEPPVLTSHTYDPSNHLSVVMEPRLNLAKENYLAHPAPVMPGHAPMKLNPNPGPGRTEEDLGTQQYQGFTLQGIRKTRTIAQPVSDTGKPIVISDEYWFSPDLTTYLIIKHNDPRTGEQLITVSHIQRAEPDASIFAIPATYKVVDETPPAPIAPR